MYASANEPGNQSGSYEKSEPNYLKVLACYTFTIHALQIIKF